MKVPGLLPGHFFVGNNGCFADEQLWENSALNVSVHLFRSSVAAIELGFPYARLPTACFSYRCICDGFSSGPIAGRLDSCGRFALLPSTFAVLGTDNQQHLVYELVITNTSAVTATLQKIEVVSGEAPSNVLATFEGDALLTHLRGAGRGPGD